jgi:hypothetical protein
MTETVPRRKFLRLVAAGAGAVALPTVGLAGVSWASEPEGDGYFGRVTEASTTTLRIDTDQGALRVQPVAGARMYSGAFGPVSDASKFITGDRVAVEGRRVGSSVHATAIGSVFSSFTARITSVSADGARVETTEGVIGLQHGRLPYADADRSVAPRWSVAVAVGDAVTGLTWQHPHTRETYLLVPGV